jgi:formate hydrogenlyase subunit 3/multisubunit Na+/H+ antiporter MnhD subunit
VPSLIHSPLDACLTLLALWGLIGLAGLSRPTSLIFVGRTLFPLGALCGVALAVVSLLSLDAPPERVVLVIGLPHLPMHLHRDALASLFLFLLGGASAGISVFAAGYFRRGHGTSAGLLCLQYHLFLASMGFLLLADDAYAFMVAWETMALSSYFLVTSQHSLPEIRRAGFLYLLMAHVGALAILLAFGVMQGGNSPSRRCAARISRPSGPRWHSSSLSSASARRRDSCPCTCGCRRPIPPRHPPSPR